MKPNKPKLGNSLAEKRPDLVQEWSNENDYTPWDIGFGSEYIAKWVCNICKYQWESIVGNRARLSINAGCPSCARQSISKSRKKPKPGESLMDLFPNIAKEYSVELNKNTPNNVKPYSNESAWFICPNKHEYYTKVVNRTSKNTGCGFCSGRYVIKGVNSLAEKYSKIACEFNISKNKESPNNIMPTANKKYWFTCPKGHEYFSSLNNRISLGRGCPYCSNQKVLTGYNDAGTLFPEILGIWSKKNQVSPFQCVNGSAKKYWFTCNKGHEWFTQLNSITRMKTGCPYCLNSGTSRIEKAMRKKLGASDKELKIDNTTESCQPFWKVDCIIDKTIIEFDGAYWHSRKGAYSQDRKKTLNLLDQGYKVIRIRELPLKSLRISKSFDYHEILWENTERDYPRELPEDIIKQVKELLDEKD